MSWDDGPFYDASFGVEKCRRYHAKLRDHYQRMHDAIKVMNVVAGSSAFVAVLSATPAVMGIFAALMALGSLIDLLFGFDKKARLHHDLCGRFTDLASSMETWEATELNLRKARAKRMQIEKDGPVVKRLVDLEAHCETARRRGVAESRLPPLTRWQRRLGCFATFGLHRIDDWNARQSA